MPGMNEIIAAAKSGHGRGVAYSRMKKEWHEIISDSIIRAGIPFIQSPVWLHFIHLEINKRRDPDNIVAAKKFVMDALVKTGVLQNDNWACVSGFRDSWMIADPPSILVHIHTDQFQVIPIREGCTT